MNRTHLTHSDCCVYVCVNVCVCVCVCTECAEYVDCVVCSRTLLQAIETVRVEVMGYASALAHLTQELQRLSLSHPIAASAPSIPSMPSTLLNPSTPCTTQLSIAPSPEAQSDSTSTAPGSLYSRHTNMRTPTLRKPDSRRQRLPNPWSLVHSWTRTYKC